MTTDVRFDAAKEDQIDLIYDSLFDMAKELEASERFTKSKDEIHRAIFKDKIAECIIGYSDIHPVSIALFSLTNRNFDLFPKPGMYIHNIYVFPEHRRKGIGEKMVAFLKDIAKRRDLGRIDFVVFNANSQALEFYKNFGDIKEVDIKYMRMNIEG